MLIKKKLGPLIALALAVVAVGLGLWQLGRMDEKKTMMMTRADRAQSLLSLGSQVLWQKDRSADQLDQQRVLLSGEWLFDQTVFLDNRAWEGQAGVHVLTPMRLADQSLVWVNRGWMAKPPGAAPVPGVPGAEPAARLEGVALASIMRRIELTRDPAALRQGSVWQNFDWSAAMERLPGPTWPVIVWQATENQDGLLRKIPEVSGDLPKHLGYALQWFLMSFVALFFAGRLWKK